jgi:hypothetical protein
MKKLVLFFFVAVFILFACSRKHLPSSSVPATSYESEVKPIIQNSCSPCHIPSKGGRVANFDSYDSSKKYIAGMIERVTLNPSSPKFMPFKAKRPPLTIPEIQILKNWQAGGLKR